MDDKTPQRAAGRLSATDEFAGLTRGGNARRMASISDVGGSVTLARRSVALLAAAVIIALAQPLGQAQTTNPLPYTGGMLVTGNYVVGGVDLTENANPIDANGFSTGTIAVSGVPPDADILAAYLFWEAITVAADPSQAAGVKFRGLDVDINDPLLVKRTSQNLVGATASCWSSGTPLAMHAFRANVLPLLPLRVDKNGDATGKRLVNSADLAAYGFLPHTVALPVRAGNNLPEGAGATLVVFYRDPNPNRVQNPLRKIVMYDGLYIQPSVDVWMEQTLQGFYQAAASKSARLTHLVGSGQPNGNDKISFNGTTIASDPFVSGSSSQRAWSNPTYDVSSLMNATTTSPVYGETAKTRVFHQPGTGGNDCLASNAIIFSTAVADQDHDGLPDGVEDSFTGLKDPDGTDLPNLKAMGAGSDQKDLFVEINAMRADPGTKYGSTSAPFNPTTPRITDTLGHQHVPTPEDLKMMGDGFAAHGIRPHFDVGDVAAFHALGVVHHSDWEDDYASTEADQYLVGNDVGSNVATLARGGELIKEVSCDAANPACHFPDYPGTVFWRLGLLYLKDMPVTDNGDDLTIEQLTDPTVSGYYDWNASTQRTRFDRGRYDLFHYLLYSHARDAPKSLPCLVDGEPAPYDLNDGTACTIANPGFNPLEYHVPSSASGISDLPGGNAMVSMGFWDEFVGRPFARAGTTFHELGHNFELWHGGRPAIWGNTATTNYFEANCKPNYLSSMSYSFQVHGLFDNADQIHLDYSSVAHDPLDETGTLADLSLFPAPVYQAAWFAPADSLLALDQGAPTATRFCSGDKFDPLHPPTPMARLTAGISSAPIDWNGDEIVNASLFQQDVNFDNFLSGAPRSLNGFNDWANLRLDQVGAQGLWPDGGGLTKLGGGLTKLGGGLTKLGGGQGFWFEGGGLTKLGGGLTKLGGGLTKLGGGLTKLGGAQEISFENAKAMGKGRPYELTACVIGKDGGCTQANAFTAAYHRIEVRFTPAPIGSFSSHEVQRKHASEPDAAFTTVDPATTTTAFTDPNELPNGVAFVYRVRGLASDGNSGWSHPSPPIIAANAPPVAVADSYSGAGKTLNIAAPGVLANDRDPDSPTAFLGRRAVRVAGPSQGTLTLNQNGSFVYTPNKCGVADSFTYTADDGPWSVDSTIALSQPSNTVAVAVIVNCGRK